MGPKRDYLGPFSPWNLLRGKTIKKWVKHSFPTYFSAMSLSHFWNLCRLWSYPQKLKLNVAYDSWLALKIVHDVVFLSTAGDKVLEILFQGWRIKIPKSSRVVFALLTWVCVSPMASRKPVWSSHLPKVKANERGLLTPEKGDNGMKTPREKCWIFKV